MQRKRDRIATAWNDNFLVASDRVKSQYVPTFRENWANYRVEPFVSGSNDAAKLDPYRINERVSSINALKTPESHQGVNTLRAVLLASLYGVRDYVQAAPVGDEDVGAAARVSQLVMYGLERPGNFRTQWDTLGDALVFGLGIGRAYWNTRSRLVPRRTPILDPSTGQPVTDPQTGLPLTVLQNVEDLIEDDVALRHASIWDTWLDPGADRFQEQNGMLERFRIRDIALDRLRRTPTWDAEGIGLALMTSPSGKPHGMDDDDPKLMTESLTEEDVKDVAAFGVYGGWRYTGMVDEETADALGLDARASATISTINGYVVQAAQNPQKNGELPYFSTTIMPTGRGLYGLSPLTVVRYLQDVSDTQLILTVQAMIEAVYQNYLVGGGATAQPNFKRNLETRQPREVFLMEGDISQVAPLTKDYQGLGIAAQSLALISQTMRDAMNARDPVQGVINQDRVTATQTQLTASAALQNVDQLAVLIERDELPVQGRLVNDLYYINLDDEGKVVRRTGQQSSVAVSFFDIDVVADIHFVGARNALSKAAKANQLRDFVQLVLSTPIGAASIDWPTFIRKYGDEALDIKGLEEIMITDPTEILARLQAMGLAGSGPIQQEQGGGETNNEAGAPRAKAQTSGGK